MKNAQTSPRLLLFVAVVIATTLVALVASADRVPVKPAAIGRNLANEIRRCKEACRKQPYSNRQEIAKCEEACMKWDYDEPPCNKWPCDPSPHAVGPELGASKD